MASRSLADLDISYLMVRIFVDDSGDWFAARHPAPLSVTTFLPPYMFACVLRPKKPGGKSLLVIDDGLDPIKGVDILVTDEDLASEPAEFYKRTLRPALEQLWYARFPEQQAAIVQRMTAIINDLAARGEATKTA